MGSELVRASHEGAAKQNRSCCASVRVLFCVRVRKTSRSMEIPDINLTLHGNVSLFPRMRLLFFMGIYHVARVCQ